MVAVDCIKKSQQGLVAHISTYKPAPKHLKWPVGATKTVKAEIIGRTAKAKDGSNAWYSIRIALAV